MRAFTGGHARLAQPARAGAAGGRSGACKALVPRSHRQTAQAGASQQVQWLLECASSGAALLAASAGVLLATADPAAAKNVRVEDVDNPSMQAGLLAANEGRFSEAERFFQIVLKDDADSASAWSNIGNVHLSLGRPQEAVADFTRAVTLAPEAPVPLLNRALAREALGVAAAADGDAASAQQLYRAALEDCEGATQRDPSEFAAWFNKGNIQARLQQYKAALSSYGTAADLAPGISGYRLRQAELLFQDGQARRSGQMMRGVLRRNPNFAEAHAALSAVQWAAGDRQAAEEHFESATRIDPSWGRMSYIRENTRWPPALYDAMQRFLSISADGS